MAYTGQMEECAILVDGWTLCLFLPLGSITADKQVQDLGTPCPPHQTL